MAVGLVILFLEGTFVKLLEAECTHEVLWVKFTVHGSDTPACDRLLTAVAQCTSPGMIMHLTVGSAIMLKEASSWKSLMTFRAHKAFRMPVSTKSRNVAIHYRVTTPSTSRSKHGIVIFTAKRLAISFVKASLTKRLTTTCTDKMFWMPRLV